MFHWNPCLEENKNDWFMCVECKFRGLLTLEKCSMISFKRVPWWWRGGHILHEFHPLMPNYISMIFHTWIGSINDSSPQSHKWEDVKMYIARLKVDIGIELKLWKPTNIVEEKYKGKLIERKLLIHIRVSFIATKKTIISIPPLSMQW